MDIQVDDNLMNISAMLHLRKQSNYYATMRTSGGTASEM